MCGFFSRDVFINAILVVLSLLLVFASIESALYIGIIESESEYPHYVACEGETAWKSHPIFGWTFQPDAVYLRQQNSLQERNLYRINSAGFRDTYNKGEREILILGDSQTAGWIVNDNRTYPFLLDENIAETTINNFGVPGYGTEQELAVYSNYSTSTDHELVILAYYPGNDMTDNLDQNPRRPEYAIRDGNITLIGKPTNESQDGSESVSLKKMLLENTRTFSYLKPRLKVVMSRLGLRKNRPPKGKELNRGLYLTESLIQEVAQKSETEGADLLILIIPTRTTINPSNPAHYPPNFNTPYVQAQRKMLRAVAHNHSNVKILDLKPAFIEERQNGRHLYGRANAHIDEYGHQVTARVLYQWLTTRGYVERNPNATFDDAAASRDQTCP